MQTETKSITLSGAQKMKVNWWEENPMTYDWEGALKVTQGSREWYEEIDRRFLSCSYFAKGPGGELFGRFMKPEFVLAVGCGQGTHPATVARAGANRTAMDLTERAIAVACRRFEGFSRWSLARGRFRLDGHAFHSW